MTSQLIHPHKAENLIYNPVELLIINPEKRVFEISDDWECIFKYGKKCFKMTLYKGFRTDGASIPKFAWGLIGAPIEGKYFVAALVHDALYGAEWVNQSTADNIFNQIMKYLKVGFLTRNTIYGAVVSFGFTAWNKHTPETISNHRKFSKFEEICSIHS